MTDTQAPANADQTTYWNEAGGPAWVALQDILDWQLAPLSRAAVEALGPREGEHILDIGCGCGASSLELAWAIDPEGSVLGVDISAPMLEVARRRADKAGYPQLRFVLADAQTHPFEAGAFDCVFSRFGVMFFEDPATAFINIRKALRPGGRMAFVCWRAMADNPLMTLPMQAAASHFDAPPGPAPDPFAPGPFAFADGERLRGILQGAGFVDIGLRAHQEMIGARTVDDAMQTALKVGPLGRALAAFPDKREAAMVSVREALTAYATPRGVLLPSATWIVTARSPH